MNAIDVSIDNKNFKYIDDSLLIYKKDEKNSDYDTLIWARRNIDQVVIPLFIKEISSYAFYGCDNLKKIEFAENSELKIISKNAFRSSRIESILVPNKVELIEEYAFYDCRYLKNIEFLDDSQLRSIGIMHLMDQE